MKHKYFTLTISFFLLISTVSAQKYIAAEKKCEQASDREKWRVAESFCKSALDIAGGLPEKNKAEKMRAFENYAFTLFSQYKFQEALNNYSQAFEIGRTFLTEDAADLAYAYLNLGRANQGLARLDAAAENFVKAEKIYRSAYEKAEVPAVKDKHKASVKRTLILQLYIADLLKNQNKHDSIQKKIADLDK